MFPKGRVSRSLVGWVLVVGEKDDGMVAGTMYCVACPVQMPHEVVDVEIRSQAILCKRILSELHWASGGSLSHKTWDRYDAILYRSEANHSSVRNSAAMKSGRLRLCRAFEIAETDEPRVYVSDTMPIPRLELCSECKRVELDSWSKLGRATTFISQPVYQAKPSWATYQITQAQRRYEP